MNLENQDTDLPSYLADVPFNIRPGFNKNVKWCRGINIPTIYLAGRHSFTEMHAEDNYLDSCNLLLWAASDGSKVWVFIHPSDNIKFNAFLSKCVKKAGEKGENVDHWLPECPAPAHHKVILLTPKMLKDAHICFETVIQNPGDLVYVGCLVYHQVMNFGICLAEAVNVGSSDWNFIVERSGVYCICKGNAIRTYEMTQTYPAKIYRCKVQGCSNTFAHKDHHALHERNHELPPAAVNTNLCILCNRIYPSAESLRKHKQRQRPLSTESLASCPHCSALKGMVTYPDTCARAKEVLFYALVAERSHLRD